MNHNFQNQWLNKTGYYYTYYGEIFFGVSVQDPKNDLGLYIVNQNNWLQNTISLNFSDLFLGAEYFPNKNVIVDFISYNQGKQIEVKPKPFIHDNQNVNFKTIYIIGAGASANSISMNGPIGKFKEDKFRPPLGNDLFHDNFDSFILKYTGVRNFARRFTRAGTQQKTIEQLFEEEWLEIRNKPAMNLHIEHIQVQFYLSELFNRISEKMKENYFKWDLFGHLAENLKANANRENATCIISFNYDTLIDNALQDVFHFEYNEMSDYINNKNKIILIKPHGSANWGWPFKFNQTPLQHQLNFISELQKNGYSMYRLMHEMLNQHHLNHQSWNLDHNNEPNYVPRYTINRDGIQLIKNNNPYMPALLMPFKDKDEFIMPSHHQIKMEAAMASAEEIVIIGWKGGEFHFNQKLNKKISQLKKITLVDPKPRDVFLNLAQSLPILEYEVLTSPSFNDYIHHPEKITVYKHT
jgi:hypothetical protein